MLGNAGVQFFEGASFFCREFVQVFLHMVGHNRSFGKWHIPKGKTFNILLARLFMGAGLRP